MKLLHSPTSPFVRKALVVAHERGLVGRLELVPVQTTPTGTDAKILPHNPLGKIPALVLDDGETLFDSRVVAEYLDSIGTAGAALHPTDPASRRRALVLQSLADGMTDAALLVRYETWLRPEALRWPAWIEGQLGKIDRALDALQPHEGLDIGHIALGCALGYLDFRFAERAWRTKRPQLAAWYADFAARPSMQATQPS